MTDNLTIAATSRRVLRSESLVSALDNMSYCLVCLKYTEAFGVRCVVAQVKFMSKPPACANVCVLLGVGGQALQGPLVFHFQQHPWLRDHYAVLD